MVELLTAYLEGALDERERASFDAHLGLCAGCVTYVDQFRETVRATGSLANTNDELRLRTLALWSAENRLVQYRIAGDLPPTGRNTFDCSQADVKLSCQEDIYATNSPLMRRVEVSVSSGGGNPRQLARLTGFASSN